MISDTPQSPRWFQRLAKSVSTLERDERKDLLGRIEQGAHGGVDYNVMMVLSAGLASFGLLQGSSAVIIGAMLVAPLVGPLVGAGLSLVQNNAHLFRKSMGVSGLGLLIGLGVSLLAGLINPGLASSLEIEARGTPDLFDLGVAILSGFVAAYAMGRPGVANTLVMIAIILLLPLLLNLVKERRRGPARPLSYPVAPHLQDAVDEYVEQHPNVQLVSMGRVTVEPASDVSIVLSSGRPLPAGFRDRLTELVHEIRGGNPNVRIFAFRELSEQHPDDVDETPR